ncbi:hypothetical protein [Bacillus sp. 1P06AnD]|uniref:hypothetical protein n=1 Tax=Bacillus sp. 1P06AnD TaxID=3132208 RepID=UPI00399FC28F
MRRGWVIGDKYFLVFSVILSASSVAILAAGGKEQPNGSQFIWASMLVVTLLMLLTLHIKKRRICETISSSLLSIVA